MAYVGTGGSSDQMLDFTALGDTASTAARPGSIVAAHELLVGATAARHAGRHALPVEPGAAEPPSKGRSALPRHGIADGQ